MGSIDCQLSECEITFKKVYLIYLIYFLVFVFCFVLIKMTDVRLTRSGQRIYEYLMQGKRTRNEEVEGNT